MKRPDWVTIVGILGIVFSCFGILGGGQEMMTPKIIEIQKEMFTNIEELVEKEFEIKNENNLRSEKESQQNGNRINFPVNFFKFFKTMFDLPEWYKSWLIISGVLKIFINGFILFVSILLLQMKQSSIKLFYWASGLSISLAIIKGIIALSITSFIGMTMMFSGMVGMVIDIVLVVVVITGEKHAFYIKKPPPLSQNI